MRTPILIVIAAVLLGGCAGGAARAVGALTYAADKAEEYVREVDETRKWVRRLCRDILEDEVEALIDAGDLDGARERLRANYPDLVLVSAITSLDEESTGFLSEPFGCN